MHKGRNIIERLDPSLHAGLKKVVVGAAVAFVAVDASSTSLSGRNGEYGAGHLGYPCAVPHAMCAHRFIGLIAAVLAAVDLWMAHNRPVSTA